MSRAHGHRRLIRPSGARDSRSIIRRRSFRSAPPTDTRDRNSVSSRSSLRVPSGANASYNAESRCVFRLSIAARDLNGVGERRVGRCHSLLGNVQRRPICRPAHVPPAALRIDHKREIVPRSWIRLWAIEARRGIEKAIRSPNCGKRFERHAIPIGPAHDHRSWRVLPESHSLASQEPGRMSGLHRSCSREWKEWGCCRLAQFRIIVVANGEGRVRLTAIAYVARTRDSG